MKPKMMQANRAYGVWVYHRRKHVWCTSCDTDPACVPVRPRKRKVHPAVGMLRELMRYCEPITGKGGDVVGCAVYDKLWAECRKVTLKV